MGAHEGLTGTRFPAEIGRAAGRHAYVRADPVDERLPRWAFVVVAIACSGLQVLLARRVFLFWDDYYFLGEARSATLTWDYLSSTLFTHFSPVTRLANWVVVDPIAAHPWVIPAVQGVLLTAVVGSATWLMVALFVAPPRRSVPACCSGFRSVWCHWATGGRREPTSCPA